MSTPIRIQLSVNADNAGAQRAVDQIASTLQTGLSRNQGLQATLQKIGGGSALGAGPNGLAAQATALQLRLNTLTGAGGNQLNRFFSNLQSGSRQSSSAFNRIGDSMIRLSGIFYSFERLGGLFNRVLVSPIVDFTKAMIRADEASRKFEYSIAGVAGGLSRARHLNRAIIDISKNSPQSVEDLRTSAQTLARTPSLAVRLGLGNPANAAAEAERFGSVIGRLGTLDPSQGSKGAQIATLNALQGGAGGLTSLRRRFGISPETLASLSGSTIAELKQDPAKTLKAIEKFTDTFIPPDAYARTANLVSVRWQKVQDAVSYALAQVGDSGVFDSIGSRLKALSSQLFDYFGSDDFQAEARKVSDSLDRVLTNVARSGERLLNAISGKPSDLSSVAGAVKSAGNLIERYGKLSDNLPAIADKIGPAITNLSSKLAAFADSVIALADAARDPVGYAKRIASGASASRQGLDANALTLDALKRAGIDTSRIGTTFYKPGTTSDHIYGEMRQQGASLPSALGRFTVETFRDAIGSNVGAVEQLDFRRLPLPQRIMAEKMYAQAQNGAIDSKTYSELGSTVVAHQANNGTLPPRADEDATTSLVRKLISREYQSPNFGALLQAAQGGSGPLGELAAREQSPVERFREVSQVFGKIKIATNDIVSFGELLGRIDEQFVESKQVLEKAIGEGDRQLLGGDDQDLRAGVAQLRKQRDLLIENYRGAFQAISNNKIDAVKDFGTALGDAIRDLPPEARVEVQRAIRDGVTSQAQQFVEIFGEPAGGMKKNFGSGSMSLEQLNQAYSSDLQTQADAISAAGRHGDILTLPTNASFEQTREIKALTPTEGQSQLLKYYNGPATENARELLARAGKEFRDTPDETSLANVRAAQAEVAELSSKIRLLEQSLPGLQRDFAEMAAGVRESLESNLGDAFVSLISGVGSLKDILRSFGQDLLRMFADIQAKNLIAGVLGGFGQPQAGGGTQTNLSGGLIGAIGTGLSSYFTGGAGATTTTSAPAYSTGFGTGGVFSNVHPLASGGIVRAGKPIVGLIGEGKSDEMILPIPRTSSGRLPVELPNGGQAPAPEVKIYNCRDEAHAFQLGYRAGGRDIIMGDVQRGIEKGKIGRR